MKNVELVSPCCLHLGCAKSGNLAGQLCELGIALQAPRIEIVVRESPAHQLSASGPRADVALSAAEQFFAKHVLPPVAEIEIETAIPAHMGLGSTAMLRAGVAKALGAMHGTTRSFRRNLAENVHDYGGLLLCNDEGLVQRHSPIKMHAEEHEWVFVLVLPDAPDDVVVVADAGTADDFEARCIANLRHAVLAEPNSEAIGAVFNAVTRDAFADFVAAVARLHAENEAALAKTGTARATSTETQALLQVLNKNGAAFAAQTLTGYGVYALVQGAEPSQRLRQAVQKHVGYFGPLVLGTVCRNRD